MSTAYEATTVAIVGESASSVDLEVVAGEPERRIFYSLSAARAFDPQSTPGDSVIDVSSELWQLDSLAERWASSLVSYLDAHTRWIPSGVLTSLERRLHIDVLWPIAVARARARRVRDAVGASATVTSIGLSEVERDALIAMGLLSETVWPAPSPSASAEARIPIGARVGTALARQRADIRRRRNATRLRANLGIVPNTPVAVILAAVPMHLKLMATPIRELRSRGYECIVLEVFAGGRLAEASRDVGSSWLNLHDYMPGDESPGLVLSTSRRGRLEHAVRTWAQASDLDAHVQTVLDGLTTELIRTRRFLSGYDVVLRDLRPAVVLSVSELYPGIEPVAVACRRLGIPTVHVQHGNIPEIARMSRFPYDAVCVFGPAYAETLARLGTPSNRIRVTGSPLLDRTPAPASRSPIRETEYAAQGHMREDGYRILFIGGYHTGFSSQALLYETLAMVLEYAAHRPEIEVVVKLHPAVSSGLWVAGYEAALADNRTANVRLVTDEDVYGLIGWADCVITRGSTVALEAAWSRKPVVLLNALGSPTHLPLDAEGVALVASSRVEFAHCVEKLRSGLAFPEDAYQAVERRYAFRLDGGAGRRIADVCMELASARHRRRSD